MYLFLVRSVSCSLEVSIIDFIHSPHVLYFVPLIVVGDSYHLMSVYRAGQYHFTLFIINKRLIIDLQNDNKAKAYSSQQATV